MPNEKTIAFRSLHQSVHMFVLPNAWCTASALLIEAAGFPSIGTTSWGIAASLGYKDGEVLSFDDMLFVVKRILACVEKPVNVDLEAGYSNEPNRIAENVIRVAELGAAGVNIEDAVYGGTSTGLRTIEHQVDVLRTIRKTLVQSDLDLFVNARIDTYLSGTFSPTEIVDETIRRGRAYVEAGADGIFVPGARDPVDIEHICKKVSAPVNVLALPGISDASALAKIGVARLSLGNAAFNWAFSQLQARILSFSEGQNVQIFFDTPPPTLSLSDRH
jgi:2-methylisocitrate lyase-like PEP mutase family enzyme